MSGTSPIELAKAEFPYLIQQEGAPVRSLITLSRTRREEFDHDDKMLFYIANGALEQAGDGEQPGVIQVRHTFARDEEDDTAKIAWFELRLVKFISSWGHHLNFQALLTEVKFWPQVRGGENPFEGAVEKKGRTEHGYSKNTGYPYIPPNVTIPGLRLPLIVDISFDVAMAPERTAKWLKKAMASHKKERLERERAAKKRAEERAAKDAERARRREAQLTWAKTDEGQEYERLRVVWLELKGAGQKSAWLDTESGKRFEELREILFNIEG